MRRAVRLAVAGVLGSSGLLVLLRPDLEDPLRLTAALLPLLAAGFIALSEGRRRAVPSGLRLGLLVAVAGWGVLAIGWRNLPLPRAEPLVAAGGAALLAGWLALELPGLLRRLAGKRGTSPPRVFFLLPLLAFIAVLPWVQAHHLPNGDEPYYLLLAHSLAYDGDIDLANNYENDDELAFMPWRIEPQKNDPTGDEGQIYSRHSPALPVILALPYRLAGRTGAALVMLALAAGTAWAGLALARELYPQRPRGQLLAWLALAFGSPLLAYSYRFWAETPAALGYTMACLLIVRLRPGHPVRASQLLALAALLVAPVLVKARFALVAAPLALLAWWRGGRRWKLALVVGLGLLATGAAVALLHLAHYDQVLGKYPIAALDWRRYPPGYWFRGLAGFLLDSAFGLIPAHPIWLLALPALAVTLQRSPASRGLLVVWAPYFLLLLPRDNAFGQFAPPFRYALALLPLLAACMVPLFEERRAFARTVIRALAALTVVLAIVWIVQPEWTVNRVTGSTHLIDRLQLLTQSDFGRLFPSYLRVRAAAWVWAGVTLLIAASWRWWPSRPRLRGLAAPLLLLAVAVIAWTASHVPTRTVEFEDTWVEHRGGSEYPKRWRPWAQPRGWRLAPGDAVQVPLVPGGGELQLSLRLRGKGDPRRRVALELLNGRDRVVYSWIQELKSTRGWEWKTLPAIELSAAQSRSLTVRMVEPPTDFPGAAPLSRRRAARGHGTIVLDRGRLEWNPESPAP